MPDLTSQTSTKPDEPEAILDDRKPGYWPMRIHWMSLGVIFFGDPLSFLYPVAVGVWLVCFIYCLNRNYDL